MEFEGVFSAIVAAVLISFGIGGDWARWTNVRNVSAPAQAGVTLAGNFSLSDLPDDNTGDILTGEPAE